MVSIGPEIMRRTIRKKGRKEKNRADSLAHILARQSASMDFILPMFWTARVRNGTSEKAEWGGMLEGISVTSLGTRTGGVCGRTDTGNVVVREEIRGVRVAKEEGGLSWWRPKKGRSYAGHRQSPSGVDE